MPVSVGAILETLPMLPVEVVRQIRDACEGLLAGYAELAHDDRIVEEREQDGKTYRLEYARCGRATCRCAQPGGQGHGPYWRAYWREDGKVKSKHIGKEFRPL